MRIVFAGVAILCLSFFGCQAQRSPMSGVPSAPAVDVDLLPNGHFDEVSAPWTEYFAPGASGSVALDSGRLCLTVTASGTNEWDAQMRARGIPLSSGHSISVRLQVTASPAATVTVKLAMQAAPYTTYWQQRVEATQDAQVLEEHFIMGAASDPAAELVVMAGGALAPTLPTQVCIDDVSVRDPDPPPRVWDSEPKPSLIRVNQLGFRPSASKFGVLLSDAAEPLPFSVVAGDGKEVFRGRSEPRGRDAASGDSVHWLDFSSFVGACEACRLQSSAARSAPFRVEEQVLHPLVTGALAYFYYNRSGVPIVMPYARDVQWTRPAGHVGDANVTCHPDRPCDYQLDASGGWYDAGDYGKYLVNGGLALFLLQNLYEHQRTRGLPAFDDGTLAIPEQHNSVPDLLDEARYEADFFLRMQVPSGPLQGMAPHKIHGIDWTSLGTAPDEHRQTRYLYPPSTAASLNLAATAAQASRLQKPYDDAFSKRALAVAQEAYRAAVAHPSELAPADSVGGGPYDDVYVEDEFAWAAAELWLTTDDPQYLQALKRSSLFGAIPSLVSAPRSDAGHYRAFTWQNVEALGTLSLLLHLERLPATDQALLRGNLLVAADRFLEASDREGYRLPYAPGQDGTYLWGSNVVVLSNAVICAYAYDISRDGRYLRAVQDALDYVLGRNTLDRSYVTGFGTRPARYPHHRFWSHSLRPDRPPPPPGALASGANSALADPAVKAAVAAGSPPQRCYVDDIEAFSVNEVAVHDNAALAWIAAYLESAP